MKKFPKPIYITRPILPSIEELTKELKDVWKSQWLSNEGPKNVLFEKKLQKVLKVPYASTFTNGTIALLIAIKSLKLTGEVITTPFTFPATPHSLTWNNLMPVFCDIDPVTMNIDANKIEALITPKTTAILAVHVFGTPCDVVKIQQIAKKHKLKVIYDAAHAFGMELHHTGIGNFGDVTMFSFHPTKLFHSGEGGVLVCKNTLLKKRFNLLKNFGIINQEEVVDVGLNGKMYEIQAALGLTVLKYVSEEQNKRKILFDTYVHELKGVPGITISENHATTKNSFQYFVMRINEKKFGISRDEVCNRFQKFNVFTRKYFYPLCSTYPHYKKLPSSKKSHLPVANQVAQEVLSMPFYGKLQPSDIRKICKILKNFRPSL